MSQLLLTFDSPRFEFSAPPAEHLVVILHGTGLDSRSLKDLIAEVQAWGRTDNVNVDIFAPNLPYYWRLNSDGAGSIVVDLLEDLDRIWTAKRGGYKRIVFVGHSLGGILARQLFLAGSRNPPDFAGPVKGHRDELLEDILKRREQKPLPCAWAPYVNRLVLLASWDKGWTISDRTAWLYSIGLNFLGFLGRFFELIDAFAEGLLPSGNGPRKIYKPGRTMLDMRRGAAFIVQTRLLWMAYRRWHNEPLRKLYNASHPKQEDRITDPPADANNPMVVQIIGDEDNFVSPQDQVDRDVEAQAGTEGAGQRYFVLSMKQTDHAEVVNFADREDRRQVFRDALTLNDEQLSKISIDPKLYFDQQQTYEPLVEDVVFVMHGIRDDGYWTHRIAKEIKALDVAERERHRKSVPPPEPQNVPEPKPMASCTPTYGYFPMGAFLLPWIRSEKVEWFMDLYVEARAHFPRARFHYVGHSNGTYLAAAALRDYPAARFGKIYFAGSVVNSTFDWTKLVRQGRVERFHNARGGTDWVVAWLPKSLEFFTDLGGGGFDGFEKAVRGAPAITQTTHFARGGHGGAITEPHWPEIAKFIVTGAKPFAAGEPTGENDPFMTERVGWIKFLSDLRIGVPLAFSIAGLAIAWLISLWLGAPERGWAALLCPHGEVCSLSAWVESAGTAPDQSVNGGWWSDKLQSVASFLAGNRGVSAWLAALAAFLALNFTRRPLKDGTYPAPRGKTAWAMGVLFFFCAAGMTYFVVSLLANAARGIAAQDSSTHWVAIEVAGATASFALLLALVKFVLTKF